MKLLVCGGAGFIGSNFVRQRVTEHGDDVTVLDKLTYAGREENLADLRDRAGFAFVHAGIEDADAVADAIAGADAVVNFAAETHVDRSIAEPDAFVKTHALRAPTCCSRPRASAACATSRSPRTRSTARSSTGSFTEQSPLAAVLALLARPRRAPTCSWQLPPHLRAADADLPRLQQLRAVPVPREADPADDPQRAPRRPAAGLRRRPAGPQLDLRRGLRARHRPRARARRARQRLQRRRPRRVREPRGRPAHHRAHRRRRRPDRVRHRPPRPRPPLLARHRRRCARSGWEAQVRFDEGLDRTVAWYRENPSGGRRSARATTARTTSASTGARSATSAPERQEPRLVMRQSRPRALELERRDRVVSSPPIRPLTRGGRRSCR